MSKFYVNQIRHPDEAGRLRVAGAEWSEHRHGVVGVIAFIGALAGVALIIGGVVVILANGRQAGALLVPPTLVLIALYFSSHLLMWRTRSLLLNVDGTIETPYGFAYRRWWKSIEGDHAYIATFELRQWSNGYSVNIYSNGGDIVHLADKLPEFQAHKIAVQLNLALRDMRASYRVTAEVSPDYDEAVQPIY